MQIHKKQFNTSGQMLIEVIGAMVVVSIVLTAAAGALMGNWSAVVKMTKVVPDNIKRDADIKLAFLDACTHPQGEQYRCFNTEEAHLKRVYIKHLKKDQVIPVLIYAANQ